MLCYELVKQGVVPKFYWPRPVPFAIKEVISSELDKLGVLEKTDHAQWPAPIVPVPKGNGPFWICGDYKSTINDDALEVDQHPLPRLDDLLATLTVEEKFTVLDILQAYQ